MMDREQAIRERMQLWKDKIQNEHIMDRDKIQDLHNKMVRDCLISLAKIMDNTYKTLLPEEITKEMFNE